MPNVKRITRQRKAVKEQHHDLYDGDSKKNPIVISHVKRGTEDAKSAHPSAGEGPQTSVFADQRDNARAAKPFPT